MDVRNYSSAADFLAAAGSLLRSDEVRYGLIYGIARRVAADPHCYGSGDPWFCIVSGKTSISALAWRTPPHLVGLAWNEGDTEETAALLIESIRDRWTVIPGVQGHREVTDVLAQNRSRNFQTTIQAAQSQRTYRLDSVNPVPQASGRIRLAVNEDRALVFGWNHAFGADTNQKSESEIPETIIKQRIDNSEIYLWEDAGQPVSMAAQNRPTEHGMAVGRVYTPPQLRRNGYATACVSELCRGILKSGYNFCTLYTDLGNPTSNSIYMKIGFRPICDSAQYTFSTAPK